MVRHVWMLTLGLGLLVTAAARAEFEECETSADAVTIGSVACRKLASDAVGAVTAFSYYVPPGCDPGQEDVRCPTLYVLHGFGGDYRSMLWTGSTSETWPDSPWISALTKGPAEDPNHVADPWNDADPAGWVALDPIDMILVAPHGRTVAGGNGPAPDLDGFWTDWNPRYAAGGEQPAYSTPPPRFEALLIEELVPYVEENFPAAAGRAARGIAGRSLGGYGSFVNALRRPDVWSTSSSISGAHNFLFVPAPNPIHAAIPPEAGAGGVSEDVILPVPGIAPSIPISVYPEELRGFLTALFALGDPAADQAYYRGHMPRDLAMNGRAGAGGAQSIHFRYLNGDAAPRRT
ncbi:MAG: alpha/beta hydrolase-fold protein, partial [Candidatus Binatia bacterium]